MDFPRDSFIQQLNGCNSQFRSSIIEYTDNLIKKGLPVIFSLKHLAGIVSVEYSELISIKKHIDGYYARKLHSMVFSKMKIAHP